MISSNKLASKKNLLSQPDKIKQFHVKLKCCCFNSKFSVHLAYKMVSLLTQLPAF